MLSRILQVSLAAICLAVFLGAPVANAKGKTSRRISSVLACDCECNYAENQCADFKNSLPEQEKNKVVQCSVQSSKVGTALRSTGACLKAPFTFAWDLATFPYVLGKALYNGAKSLPMALSALAEGIGQESACYSDREMKLRLLAPVIHSFYVDPESPNPQLNGEAQAMLHWTCADIRERVSRKILSFKKVLFCIENKTSINSSTPGSVCVNTPTPRQIADAQEYDRKRVIDQTVFDQLAYLYRGKFNCYTAEAQTEEYCRLAVDVAAAIPAVWSGTVRLGAVALAKVAQEAIQAQRSYELLTLLAENGGSIDKVKQMKYSLDSFRGMDSAAFQKSLAAAGEQLQLFEREYGGELRSLSRAEQAKTYGLIAKAIDKGYEPEEIRAILKDTSCAL